jgi:hypothetical protein
MIARETIAHVSSIQRTMKRKLGTPFVFLGDEIYIMAKSAAAADDSLSGFPADREWRWHGAHFPEAINSALKKKPSSSECEARFAQERCSNLTCVKAWIGSAPT